MDLFKNIDKTGFDTREGFLGNTADNFMNKPLVYGNNFSQLYQGRLGKAAGLLISRAQEEFKFIQCAADMGCDSRHNDVAGKFIESVWRDNQRRPLFSGAKVGERERDEGYLSLFIKCHIQNLRGYSRNQMISPPLLTEKSQRNVISEAGVVRAGVSVGSLRVVSGLRILIAVMSFLSPLGKSLSYVYLDVKVRLERHLQAASTTAPCRRPKSRSCIVSIGRRSL